MKGETFFCYEWHYKLWQGSKSQLSYEIHGKIQVKEKITFCQKKVQV